MCIFWHITISNLRMAQNTLYFLLSHSLQPQKAMINKQLYLPYYVKSMTKQQVVIAMDASTYRILNGKYSLVH